MILQIDENAEEIYFPDPHYGDEDNCVIKGSNRGLGIQNRDEGTVTDVGELNGVFHVQKPT